jgi:hypothetical protein
VWAGRVHAGNGRPFGLLRTSATTGPESDVLVVTTAVTAFRPTVTAASLYSRPFSVSWLRICLNMSWWLSSCRSLAGPRLRGSDGLAVKVASARSPWAHGGATASARRWSAHSVAHLPTRWRLPASAKLTTPPLLAARRYWHAASRRTGTGGRGPVRLLRTFQGARSKTWIYYKHCSRRHTDIRDTAAL